MVGEELSNLNVRCYERAQFTSSYINAAAGSLVRCRFGSHEPVVGTIFYMAGFVDPFIECASSSSEANGGVETGHEVISVSINEQNFLPSLSYCAATSDNSGVRRLLTMRKGSR